MWFSPAIISIIIVIATGVLFATEALPLPVTAVASAAAMGVFGVIPFSKAFSGFSSDSTMLVAGVIVAGEAMFVTGAAQLLGEKLVAAVGGNEKILLAGAIALTCLLSAFFSNTATVAMMLPILGSAAAASGGKVTKKNTYMAIGMAAIAGGGCTLVGSTPQLIAQGILQETGCETMGFFDLAAGGVPKCILMIIYYATIGYALQRRVFTFDEVKAHTSAPEDMDIKKDPKKMIITSAVMVLAVAGFVTQVFPVGGIAVIAALICIATGCISVQEVYRRMDWTCILVLSGTIGMAAGLSDGGGGKLIADTIVKLLGENMNMYTFMVIISILAMVLGNIMSHAATTSMLSTISIFVALQMGFDPKVIVLVIINSVSIAYMTPVSTPPMTMTLSGGYRFMDYVKLGAPLTVLTAILNFALYPIIFTLS